MIRPLHYISVLLFVMLCGNAIAQTATESPYSRFGPGELLFNGYAHQQALGGTAIADYGSGRLNFINPAAYGYDTLAIVEFGVHGDYIQFKQGQNSTLKRNATLSYLSFGLPLKRNHWSMTFGILPFSATGYQVEAERTLDSIGRYVSSFEGRGGYNRFYVGTGVRIGKNLSAGVNVSYLFGSVSQTSRLSFDNFAFFDTRYKQETRLSDVYYEFGLQWQKDLKNKLNLSIGIVGAPALDVNTYSSVEWVTFNNANFVESVRDTILNVVDQKGITTLPQYFGIGIGLSEGRKWGVLADFKYQDWSSYKAPGVNDTLNNSFRFSAGARFTPDEKGLRFTGRMNYRAGFFYNQSFLNIRSTQLNDMGLTLGFGIPLRKSYQSMLNFTLIGGQRGTTDNSLVRERYFRLQFGVTFNEDWFRRRRYD
jgi:hypothetical protein